MQVTAGDSLRAMCIPLLRVAEYASATRRSAAEALSAVGRKPMLRAVRIAGSPACLVGGLL